MLIHKSALLFVYALYFKIHMSFCYFILIKRKLAIDSPNASSFANVFQL